MRKKLLAVILCASMLFPASVSAEVLGYEATLDTYTKEKKTPQQFQIDDGAGNTVNVLAKSDTLYVTAKNTEIRSNPGDSGTELRSVILGTKLERVAVCDNGWSKVTFQKKGEDKIIGYVSDSVLSDTEIVNKFTDTVTAAQDSDILDYPGNQYIGSGSAEKCDVVLSEWLCECRNRKSDSGKGSRGTGSKYGTK